MIKSSHLSGNINQWNQLLMEVVRRLDKTQDSIDASRSLISNMKSLLTDMREYGNNDIEQIRFLEGLALSVSRTISAKIVSATGLSKRSLEYAKEMRKGFDDETIKAKKESESEITNDND